MGVQLDLQKRIARLRIEANFTAIGPYLEAAVLAESQGDPEEAYRYLEDAIEMNWKLSEPYVAIVEIALALGRTQEARGYFKQGLDLSDNPSALVGAFGKTFGEDVFYVPLPEGSRYLLVIPAYGTSVGNLLAVFDAYFTAFTSQDDVLLVVPALANEVQGVVERLQPALAGLGFAAERTPKIVVQPVASGEALRPLIYRAFAICGGDAVDAAALTIAERLGVQRLDDISPEGFKRLFSVRTA